MEEHINMKKLFGTRTRFMCRTGFACGGKL